MNADRTRSGRIPELDGVRGLAAVSVMAFHWILVTPAFPTGPAVGPLDHGLNWLAGTPLRALLAGPEMVLLFFVLSGLVLSLPFIDGRPLEIKMFLANRAFRIYPVAWLAACAGLAVTLIKVGSLPRGWPPWLTSELTFPAATRDPIHYLALVAPFNPSRLDGPLWSMEQELRVSLLFPVLLWTVRRTRTPLVAAAAAGLIVLGTYLSLDITSWRWTLVPVGCFLLGMLIARHRSCLTTVWRSAPGVTRGFLLLVAGVCLWLPYAPQPNVLASADLLRLIPTLGACVLLVAALCGQRTAWLRARACQWLGAISYSVYVWHAVVLAALIRALPAGVPPLAAAPLGIAATLVLAHYSYRIVERPAARWGRRQIAEGRSRRPVAVQFDAKLPSPGGA